MQLCQCFTRYKQPFSQERQNFTFEGSFFRSGKMPFIPNSTYWRELDLSGLNLTNGVIKVKQLQYLETINLAGKVRVSYLYEITWL